MLGRCQDIKAETGQHFDKDHGPTIPRIVEIERVHPECIIVIIYSVENLGSRMVICIKRSTSNQSVLFLSGELCRIEQTYESSRTQQDFVQWSIKHEIIGRVTISE